MKNLQSNQIYFDRSNFNDSIATKTNWYPMKLGGTNFQTHKLVTVNPNRLEFKATLLAKLFYSTFSFFGIIVLVDFYFSDFLINGLSFNKDTIMTLFVSFILIGVSSILFYFGTKPIIFDKNKGFFWKGWKEPDKIFNKKDLKYFTKLEQIHALQIISEYIHDRKNSYYSYELNIILKDGKRINIIDHSNLNILQNDASTISKFLNIPIWNITV